MANGLFNLKQVIQAVQQGGWPNQKTPSVEYLVVAGGGAGGNNGGGGGAGGLLTGLDPVPNGQTLLVTVGAGGAGQTYANRPSITGGSNSVFGQIVSTGGGQGGTESNNWGNGTGFGASGGSGGGGGYGGTVIAGGQGTSGQGNAGGTNAGNALNGYGGGGGAGTVGINAPATNLAGNGGAGIASAISGTVTAYAGGGGGGCGGGGATAGTGGAGGGGAGGTVNGTNGTANTGGGGGGSPGGTSGNGGSGIVIVSYPDVYAAATSTTGSPTVSTSGSGSLVFNGSAQYLSYGGQTPFAFGTGDFTIEFWMYLNSFTSPILVDWRAGGSNGAFPTLYMSALSLRYLVNGTDAITSSSLSLSTWYHVTVCRTGTVTKMYINGTQAGSSYTDTTNYTVNGTSPWIGAATGSLNGNITNFRAVKGVCVYTGTFTPPTGPLAAVQPAGTNIAAITGTQTSLLLNSVSGARLADTSTNSYVASLTGTAMTWDALSPFTGTGYKNRVYTWTSSGSITF